MPPPEIVTERDYTRDGDDEIIEALDAQNISIENLPIPYDRNFLELCKDFGDSYPTAKKDYFQNKNFQPELYKFFEEYLIFRGKIKEPPLRKGSRLLRMCFAKSAVDVDYNLDSQKRLERESKLEANAVRFVWAYIDNYFSKYSGKPQL